MNVQRFAPTLLAVLLVSGCSSGVKDDSVLATVGDRTITAGQYRQALERMEPGERPDLSTLEAREDFLGDIINKNLLEMAADEYYPELPLQVQWRMERARRTRLIADTRVRLVDSQVKVTEKDKDLAFEISQRDLDLDAILVPDKDMGLALCERLDGGASFEELAADYTIREADPGKEVWQLGWVAMDRFKWLMEKEIWTAQVGDVVGPLENLEGWWIFRINDSRPAPAETSREADDQRLGDYIREPVHLDRARVVRDSLRAAAGVAYPAKGEQLLLYKYYWEPPEGMEDDPMAFLNDPRVKPTFTAEEETVIVVSFTDQPDWTASEYADRLEWYGPGLWPRGHSVEQLEEALDLVVRDHLMMKAGEDLGVSDSEEYKEELANRFAQMKVNQLYTNVIVAGAEPTEEDIQAWFAENRDRYRASPSYRLAMFGSADEAAMRELVADWRAGASFTEIREKYEGRVGDLDFQGDTSWIHMGNDIALDDAVTPVADGGVGEPFLRDGKWWVFRVIDRRGERLTAYEEVKDLVDGDAATMAKERALLEFLEEQREKYPVTIDTGTLAKMKLPGPDGEAAAAS